jgi:ribosome-binding factor A
MSDRRVKRLNSLLREVISEVIRNELKNPIISSLTTVTEVNVSKDLDNAKVFISIIEPEVKKQQTMSALASAAGYISVLASKKVTLRHFPSLIFKLDDSYDRYTKIDELLKKIEDDKKPN